LLREVSADGPRSPEDWQTFSRLGIALLSLSTVIASRTGTLTEEFLEERIQIGLNDLFIPIDLPTELNQTLPWLTSGDEGVA
jgi:hypothetical protein